MVKEGVFSFERCFDAKIKKPALIFLPMLSANIKSLLIVYNFAFLNSKTSFPSNFSLAFLKSNNLIKLFLMLIPAGSLEEETIAMFIYGKNVKRYKNPPKLDKYLNKIG